MRMRPPLLTLFILVFTLTIAAFPAFAAEPQKSITTNGEGIIKVAPEVASIYLSVEGYGKTAKEARDKNAIAMNNVMKELQKIGVTKEEIQAVSFNVYPTYNFNPEKNQSIITGYQAVNQVVIKTDKLEKIGIIVDAAIDAGANNVQNINYSVKDEEAWTLKALEKATLAASKKAKTISKTLGITIKGINSVSEQGSYVRTFDTGANYSKAVRAEASQSTPIQSPEFIEIRANVSINFGI